MRSISPRRSSVACCRWCSAPRILSTRCRVTSRWYVREEVQMEGLVRNLDGFSRFLETVCFSHGQLLNVSNIARDSSVSRKAVEGYLSVIGDLLLSFRLPVFRKRAARATVAHDKFYLFDCGVFRGLRPAGPLDRPEEIAGAALEGLVAQHLRAWLAYRNGGERLYYWRTRAGSEVDFIIYGPDQFTAIEVKHSAIVRRSDLHALRSFHDDYPEAQRLLLYLGDEQLHVDGVQCMPCERFLRALHPHRNFPLRSASR